MIDPRTLETEGLNLKIKLLLKGATMVAAALLFGYIIARFLCEYIC